MSVTTRTEPLSSASLNVLPPRRARFNAGKVLNARWTALKSLVEDFVILGQFAFGQEYAPRPRKV